MSSKKLNLSDIKIQSFVTSLNPDQLDLVKGGLQVTIQGKKTNYNVRWTSTDTRVEHPDSLTLGKKNVK